MNRLILASASRARAGMLERAGVPVLCDPADIDESAIKYQCRVAGASTEAAADILAERKAHAVSLRHPGALVLGADQMLECRGVWYDKPEDPVRAARHLAVLSGQTHRLVSAAVVVRDGVRLWETVDTATLTMRPFGEDFIRTYLEAAGDEVLQSVGVYQLEGLGAQLFERVEGDFFTILGLPLLPVLGFLRDQGILGT